MKTKFLEDSGSEEEGVTFEFRYIGEHTRNRITFRESPIYTEEYYPRVKELWIHRKTSPRSLIKTLEVVYDCDEPWWYPVALLEEERQAGEVEIREQL